MFSIVTIIRTEITITTIFKAYRGGTGKCNNDFLHGSVQNQLISNDFLQGSHRLFIVTMRVRSNSEIILDLKCLRQRRDLNPGQLMGRVNQHEVCQAALYRPSPAEPASSSCDKQAICYL